MLEIETKTRIDHRSHETSSKNIPIIPGFHPINSCTTTWTATSLVNDDGRSGWLTGDEGKRRQACTVLEDERWSITV